MTVYLTQEEVYVLHDALIRRFGGSQGIRDAGLIDAALARPRSGYYDTLAHQAAALMQSLARNHPFVDGNKRVAFAATAAFLRLNGWRLSVSADDAESFIILEVIVDHANVDELAARISRWMVAIPT